MPQPAHLAACENQVLSGVAFVQGAPTRFIREDTAFEVSAQESAAIRLGDGSRAEFDPASQAILRGREEGARQVVEILGGGGTFSVAKAEERFQVQTSIGTVTALGTEFTVRLLPAEIRGNPATNLRKVLYVAVLSGLVQVDFADRSYVLTGGESRVFGREKESREPRLGELRGGLSAIGANEITVANRKEKQTLHTTLWLAPDCPVTIDGKPAQVHDLAEGMPVLVQRQEGSLVAVNIRAEGPSVGGEVVAVDSDAGTIVLAGQRGEGGKGSDRSLQLAPDPKVTINGEPGKLEQIQPGAKVALKLSARDGRTVVEIVMGYRKEFGKRDGETREGRSEGRERARRERD